LLGNERISGLHLYANAIDAEAPKRLEPADSYGLGDEQRTITDMMLPKLLDSTRKED
jgi:hypothetical protein